MMEPAVVAPAVAARPSGAQCAVHPDQPAVMTCVRCGSFACASCQGNQGHCRKCASGGLEMDKVRRVARAQRRVITTFGLSILVLPLAFFTPALNSVGAKGGAIFSLIILFATLAVRVVMLVAIYQLASALGKGIPVLWSVGALLPGLIGIIVLLVLSSHATTFLRAHGVEVGFLGAKNV
jgi:hypothetical protein